MKIRVSKESFCSGENAKKEELKKEIERQKKQPGAVIPILQKAQEIFGYLPEEVQRFVAEELNLPLEDVYAVATFYSQFSLKPKGKHEISVCMGTACYVKGADKILEKLSEILKIKSGDCTKDGKFSLSECRCLGACGMAPVMKINNDVYGNLTPEKVEEILKSYKN